MSHRQLLSGPNGRVQVVQTSFLGYTPAVLLRVVVNFNKPPRRATSFPCIKCEKKDDEKYVDVTVERYPYSSYYDSSSGQWEPASGARSSIPGPEYWPEGTSNRVRAARAPEPTGESEGSPSFGKRPGSRRKKYKTSTAASESSETSVTDGTEDPELSPDVSGSSQVSEISVESSEEVGRESSNDVTEEGKDILSEYVVYQEGGEEELTGYDLDKKIGRPHPFVDPRVRRSMDDRRPQEELWWHRRKPEKQFWSRWQRRKPDVETVFLKAMAETGEIKLFGETPTLTEAALYRARRHVFKAERLQAEKDRLEKIGPLAYYSEWVKKWKRDTSREAVQKHFEETGDDENVQLLEMFSYQTAKEYRIMRGTDIRVPRDPLAMRMREELVKQIWGGDPVYPTVNYIQDPNEVIDYRGENFHEPTPKMLDYLMERGQVISREEFNKLVGEEKPKKEPEEKKADDAMANAIDIGEKDLGDDSDDDDDDDSDSDMEFKGEDDVEVSDTEFKGENDVEVSDTEFKSEDDVGVEGEEEDEKLTDGWSILKSTPQLRKSKGKAKEPKKGPMSINEAVEDAENLTDFLLDFDEEA